MKGYLNENVGSTAVTTILVLMVIDAFSYISIQKMNEHIFNSDLAKLYPYYMAMAFVQLIFFFFIFAKEYNGESLNQFLSYGYTRKDILNMTISKMLMFFFIYNGFAAILLVTSYGIKKSLLILLFKFIGYCIYIPLFLAMLKDFDLKYLFIRIAIVVSLGYFIPIIILDIVYAIYLLKVVKTKFFFENLV